MYVCDSLNGIKGQSKDLNGISFTKLNFPLPLVIVSFHVLFRNPINMR